MDSETINGSVDRDETEFAQILNKNPENFWPNLNHMS